MTGSKTTVKGSRQALIKRQNTPLTGISWQGDANKISYDLPAVRKQLLDLNSPAWIIENEEVGITTSGNAVPFANANGNGSHASLVAFLPPSPLENLGDSHFCKHYGTRYAYYGGAMANGIASAKMVIELGKAGFMGSFGSAGLGPARIEAAIEEIRAALPDGPYAFNLINSPNEPAMEKRAAELFVSRQISTVEASAYLDLTINLVWYRVAGLTLSPDGKIVAKNRIIAKLSRKEVAKRFMEPAPEDILSLLLQEGKITEQQANMARSIPVADDITVEADSGGHTDNRPLVGLIPAILTLRDEIQEKYQYPVPVRIGAGGGVSTPASALAAFMMGAAYVVTGSVNQACIESGASEHTKKLLAQAEMADVTMAPAADMFEMGVKVQLLKRGTMFPTRAKKLYEIYSRYNTIEEIPAEERKKLETQVFRREFDAIWTDTVKFFEERDPGQIERANRDPHQKMALIFRWYLGLSSRWSNSGEKGREMDYQIWCGPSMGVFNEWVRGTYLEEPENRRVADVAAHILTGAAYLSRLRLLNAFGISTSPALERYIPESPLL